MENLYAGLEMLARWDVVLALFVGSIGGVIIGAIPGVGPAVAIAILLPATFSLDPIVGLTMLLGIYGSSMYGGAIPAILINTPGTAVNALTSYDGYPMTQNGDGHRALSLAYSASFWGGIFGIGCLILLSPVLALIAPMFGSREIFLAALLGIILVVLAHRGQIFAAGILAMFGIFLQTVGLDAVTYTQRYTFGYSFLSSGINLIVVVLGLFALSQAFFLLTAPDNVPDAKPVQGKMTAGIKELMKHKRVATVASAFGVVLGMIPGTGEFQNHIDLVYGLYFALILLNVIVMIFLLFSTNLLTKIIRVPTRFLGVMILILSFVGVYSLRNSLTDCMISASFGVLGLVLKRLNLPIVPIILGMVLGGIMEVKLRSAMPRLKTPFDMIDRPISFILFTIIILVLALHLRTLVKEYRAHQGPEDHDLHDSQTR